MRVPKEVPNGCNREDAAWILAMSCDAMASLVCEVKLCGGKVVRKTKSRTRGKEKDKKKKEEEEE
jgi:hypothetical protein